jgi:TnpA family transposase
MGSTLNYPFSKKTNSTLKALFAFDEIIMTDYMLDYIDIKEVREVVQASLNRGESYHQLSYTIAKGQRRQDAERQE